MENGWRFIFFSQISEVRFWWNKNKRIPTRFPYLPFCKRKEAFRYSIKHNEYSDIHINFGSENEKSFGMSNRTEMKRLSRVILAFGVWMVKFKMNNNSTSEILCQRWEMKLTKCLTDVHNLMNTFRMPVNWVVLKAELPRETVPLSTSIKWWITVCNRLHFLFQRHSSYRRCFHR